MIWKTTTLVSLALCVLGDGPHAISEQRIKINKQEQQKHQGDLVRIGSSSPEHHEEYAWSYPSYEFSYKVHDPHTHDMKGQQESRHGDEVKGEYWLVQPDGHKRTVTYYADKHSGFKATVKYSDKDGGDDNNQGEEGGDDKNDSKKKDEGSTEDEGNNVEGGDEGEESRGSKGYKQAWLIARKEHGKAESRQEERRDNDRGRDYFGDSPILSKLAGYGHKEYRPKDDNRDYGESRGWEERHRPHQKSYDTYKYPRYYRHIQEQRPHH